MTHCYNCGHAGTFVLLVQFALAVPGPDARVPRDVDGRGSPVRGSPDRFDAVRDSPGRADAREGRRPHRDDASRRRDANRRASGSRRDARRGNDSSRDASTRRGNDSRRDDFDRDRRLEPGDLPPGGDLSLAVQCPACDSTDVGVAAADLLARYGSSTTS